MTWVPTGVPVEQVAWPAIAPDESTRTGWLTNKSLDPSDDYYTQNLWITRVAQGWKLNGVTGQTQKDRIFYPNNLSQVPITIEGIMPNQLEYDKLVKFIMTHHTSAVSDTGTGATANAVTFTLPQGLLDLPNGPMSSYRADAFMSAGKIVRRYYRQMLYDGFITSIIAGHQRFTYAPTFTMQMVISYDYIDERVEIAKQISTLLGNNGTFGDTNSNIQKNYNAGLAPAGWEYGGQDGVFSGLSPASPPASAAGPPVPNSDPSTLNTTIDAISSWVVKP